MIRPSLAVLVFDSLIRFRLLFVILPLAFIGAHTGIWRTVVPTALAQTHTYTNPLNVNIPSGGRVGSCADPTIMRGQQPGDSYWYMYCTSDPLNDVDRNATGGFNFHLLPIHKSADLVNWTYVGDVFNARPAWVAGDAGLWAPDMEFFDGLYHLYYAASETNLPGGGSAIGVAVSQSPTGPWTDAGAPVVEPHAASCCPGAKRAVIDPEVITDDTGQKYIYYGSFFGGISVRKLSADGLSSDPATQTQIAIADRYEAADVVKHAGYYYLFVSATNCCNGPLSGYSVFAGRATSPFGPFVDRDGLSLLAGPVGGTLVLSMNGNRWVGPGHSEVFTDFKGADWLLYHAIDRNDPYFAGTANFTKRPVLMDPLDWLDGWPTVRGGRWASDQAQAGPAAQPGDDSQRQLMGPIPDVPGAQIAALSDEFNAGGLSSQWQWVRPPAVGTYGLTGATFRFNTQAADLFEDSNNASLLIEPTPPDDYIVETRVRLNLPPEGCCYNYVQAGLVLYGDDDNYIKLGHVAIWGTRQTEFAKELTRPLPGYPRYGNTVIGTPDEWTYLRIVKRTMANVEQYTGYTSRDGTTWVRGGTWTHQLGAHAHIGLMSMGGPGFVAEYDYVRVYGLSADVPVPTVQFDVANFNVNEGAGRATITVTRTGDTVGPASVEYRTQDMDTFTVGCADTVNNHGGAYGRCDFATIVGTLQFVAGETSKTISVPVIDDAFVEGAETFQVQLSNVVGATSGTPATATVTIQDNDQAGQANPVFSAPFFVRQQYLDFLSREPDTPGFNAWLSVLNNCADVNNVDPAAPSAGCDRITVSNSFFGSQEFQLKGFFVFRFYRVAFDRLPQYTEIVSDMSAVTGTTPQAVFQKKATFTNAFTQRPEFINTYGALTNQQYVTTLLGRYNLTQITTPDPQQPDGTTKVTLTQADLTDGLNANTLTRAQVLRALADSDQVFNAEFNKAFVGMQYYGYLRRKPDTPGFNAWLNYLTTHPMDFRTMVNGFLNSQEYRFRFGSLS